MHADLSPTAVFALTTAGHDIFSAMTRLAVASLRRSNPAMAIHLALDEDSATALQRIRHPLLEEADQWLAVAVPPGTAPFRNRHLKTRLRQVIQGKFLFLDSDVFVRGSLADIFSLDTDIAAAPNHSRDERQAQLSPQDGAILQALSWQVDSRHYVNGGVIFYNDTPAAHRLASAWHGHWQHSSRQLGQHLDQPALNRALFAERPRFHLLPHAYNHQLKWAGQWQQLPVIWHYNHSSRTETRSCFESYAIELLHGAPLSPERITALAHCPPSP